MKKTLIQLLKNCKNNSAHLPDVKVGLLGDSATQLLTKAIQGEAYDCGYHFDIFESGYDQIDAQILDTQSELYKHKPQYVILYMCTEKLYHTFCLTPVSERLQFADRIISKIHTYWSLINENIDCSILQFTFAELDDRIFGNYAYKNNLTFLYQIKKLNYLLMTASENYRNTFFLDLNSIYLRYGYQTITDPVVYYSSKMPLSTNILPVIAKEVLDVFKALYGKLHKCIICDLDNTLWGGIIGDDGIENIEIGDLGRGQAFFDLQVWLKELSKRGILLAVCSKNNESTAKEPFISHPEMVLRLDDFTAFTANWNDKPSNIKEIQQLLNIGMDSIIFLDDSKFERESVKQQIPDITVPELPDDPALYLDYLKSLNLFETASYSAEDTDRIKQYQAEIGRKQIQSNYTNYDDYLESLNMIVEVQPFNPSNLPRIAQLSQRSNQFNLRTIRYNEDQLSKIIDSEQFITMSFSLDDIFGSYGLVSYVILKRIDENCLFINDWVMSCRVLKRGMEEFIINKLVEHSKSHGFKIITAEYIETPKNSLVRDLYEHLNFNKINNNYSLNIYNYQPKVTFIKDKNSI